MPTLHEFLATHSLCHGIGKLDKDGNGECCSIAALNWCLYGEFNDVLHVTESLVIGQWVIQIQEAMPLEMLNSERWKAALEKLPGLGQKPEKERARLRVIMYWLWGTALSQLQPMADRYGFGEEWRSMLKQRTADATYDTYAACAIRAVRAAARAAGAAADAAAEATKVARAADAARAAALDAADDAARDAADAVAYAVARAAAYAASWAAAYAAAYAASWAAARAADEAHIWELVDPCGLLERLVAI